MTRRSVLGSLAHHLVNKVVVDFSGCFHLRHSYGIGGLGYTICMIWGQAFPFLALHFYHEEDAKAIGARNGCRRLNPLLS